MSAIEASLRDDQRMALASLRAFMEAELYPHEVAVDRAGEVAPAIGERIAARAREMGFYAFNLPPEVGGGGLDYTTRAVFERELGKVTHALHEWVARPTEILMACNDEQRERYLAPCVRGDKTESFALTEPGAGSDILSMQTRARRDGGDWLISGTKHFISCVRRPDFAIVFAATGLDRTPKGERKRVTAFLVDVGTPGFDIRRGPRPVSQRAYQNFVLGFDDCRVPASQILGEEGKGLELANKWLGMGRVWVGAGCCGKAERLLDLAVQWAGTRQQFGRPIGDFQGTAFKLADMATELRAADLLVFDAARRADEGRMDPDDAAMAKLFCSEMLGRAADHTLQIYGGMGLMEDLPIERLWRDARLERIWDGTSEIQRHIISRSLLRRARA
jgi:acyl-CoA dehydrogenase